jgi:hypothetical protein
MILFAFLGIFSAYYRVLAKEAFKCAFGLSEGCSTNLDKRFKIKVVAKLSRISPMLAKFTLRNFKVISYCFVVLVLLLTSYLGYAGYNFYRYGNCNGPGSGEFCMFDINAKYSSITSCNADTGDAKCNGLNEGLFVKTGSGRKVYLFYSYNCNKSKDVYYKLKALQKSHNLSIVYVPIPTINNTILNQLSYCVFKIDGMKRFDEYNNLMFQKANKLAIGKSINSLALIKTLSSKGFNIEKYSNCLNSEIFNNQSKNLKLLSIPGTPIVYIKYKDLILLGDKPKRVYELNIW